jgi:nucleoside-diphosphate-sugar epimerase
MAAVTVPRILLTGATGYIGGTILTKLLDSTTPSAFSNASITCLVRGEDRAAKLASVYGDRVRSIVYKDLEDIEATTAAAAQHDVVINTTLGFHAASAQALLRGLGQRKAATGHQVWFIHTSGTSNLADQPISGKWIEEKREFDDAKDDIYGYERQREAIRPYTQRSVELGVVDTGLELGVNTLVVMSPTIFGLGTGLFNKISMQIPTYIRAGLKHGRALVVGEGSGVWDHVHVEDVAELYIVVLLEILQNEGRALPKGRKGIMFSENGHHSWMEVALGAAAACYEESKIADKEVESVSLSEAKGLLSLDIGVVDEDVVELGLSSNSRTVSSVARSLGWRPTRGEEAWNQGFRDDLQAVLKTIQTA